MERRFKNLIAGHESSVPQPAGVGGLDGSRNGHLMYEKRPYPKFNGKKQNFPSFRREWAETVTNKFPAKFELRLIRDNVPDEVKPDIKNLRQMTEVWMVLDEEYGQVMELTAELIEDLTDFHFTKEARTEDAKFTELYRVWQQVNAEFSEMGKVSVLNHEPTLSKFASRLPSQASRLKCVELRLERQEEAEPKSELGIMTAFLAQERNRQKHLVRLVVKKEEPQALTPGKAARRCFDCKKVGHVSGECPEKGRSGKKTTLVNRSHASMKIVPKVCPACNSQHSFDYEGETLYRTRLSSCPNFTNLGPAERACMIQTAGGCALCLDWT